MITPNCPIRILKWNRLHITVWHPECFFPNLALQLLYFQFPASVHQFATDTPAAYSSLFVLECSVNFLEVVQFGVLFVTNQS